MPEVQRVFSHGGRFIAFGATGRAGNAKGRKIALPALPYSRLTALRSLLSVALSSARLLDSITLAFFHTKWSRFQFQNGPVFDFNFNLVSYQLGSFSLLKWARFHLQKTTRLGYASPPVPCLCRSAWGSPDSLHSCKSGIQAGQAEFRDARQNFFGRSNPSQYLSTHKTGHIILHAQAYQTIFGKLLRGQSEPGFASQTP